MEERRKRKKAEKGKREGRGLAQPTPFSSHSTLGSPSPR